MKYPIEIRHPYKGEYLMIQRLHIENFRCFKSVDIKKLRRINIIVGKNASGKTVLLESIKLGLDGLPQALPWLNQLRHIPTVLFSNPNSEQFQSLFIDFFWFIRLMRTFDLKKMDIQPQKEIVRDFLLWEGKHVHKSFVSRFWSGWL